jgi:hypothetical protein
LEDYYFFPENYSYSPFNKSHIGQDFTGLHKDYDSDGDGIPDWFEMIISDNNISDNNNDDEGENNCLIATAAYGTPMASEVRILRVFRNEYLLTNPIGEGFVNTYYKVSPDIALFIKEHPILKSIVRNALTPLIWMSERSIE